MVKWGISLQIKNRRLSVSGETTGKGQRNEIFLSKLANVQAFNSVCTTTRHLYVLSTISYYHLSE